MPSKLDVALEWAEAGYFVFPCGRETGKIPLTEHGVHDATTDAGTIRAWWTANPDANIGCDVGRSGFAVLDIDDKGEKHGTETLQELERLNGPLPTTYTVHTPNGGRHLWFVGALPNSVGKLGSGLDTRGRGAEGMPGYVLLPGSAINGRSYDTADDSEPAHLPAWIAETLERHTRDRESRLSSNTDLDTPENTRRAVAWLATREPAVEGNNGDQWTLTTAMFLRDMGISEASAVEILAPWNERCVPPWLDDALAEKVTNAYRYGQNEPGSKGARSIAEMGFNRIATTQLDPYHAYTREEQELWTPPEWYVPDWIQKRSTLILFGATMTFKSFIALDIAASMSTGLPILALDYEPSPLRVLYVAGEDAFGLGKLRRPAWETARQVQTPMRIIKEMPPLERFNEFCESIDKQELRPEIIVLDTTTTMLLGKDFSKVDVAGEAVQFINGLRDAFGCTVIAVHHTGKNVDKGEFGSFLFRSQFDTSIECERKGEDLSVTLQVRKQKNAQAPKPMLLSGRRVADSLVFGPILDEDGVALTAAPSTNARSEEIGTALRNRGALNRGRALTTAVLASEILRMRGQLTTDDGSNVRAINDLGSELRRATRKFAQYIVSGPGEEYRWAWIETTPTEVSDL